MIADKDESFRIMGGAAVQLIHRTGCDNGPCPKVLDADSPPPGGEAEAAGWAAVQGKKITDPHALDGMWVPDDETIGLVPRAMLDEYVTVRHTAGRPDPGMEEADHWFDGPWRTVTRLEVRQSFNVQEEADRLAAFRAGAPRPERSVRTSPWLARIAASTVIQGKQWRRIRIIKRPLSPYIRYQIPGYVESAAAGDEVLIADATGNQQLQELDSEFFLFDAGKPTAFALLVRYDAEGRFTHMAHTVRPADLTRCAQQLELASAHAVPLNTFLAADGEARAAA